MDSSNLEFEKLEYEKAIDTFQNQYNLGVQIISGLVAADVVVAGFAASIEHAGILLAGAIFPLVAWEIVNIVNKILVPIAYRIVTLEDRHLTPDQDGFISLYIAANQRSDAYLDELRAISQIDDQKKRIQRLRQMPRLVIGNNEMRFVLGLVFAAQVVIPLALAQFNGWQLL